MLLGIVLTMKEQGSDLRSPAFRPGSSLPQSAETQTAVCGAVVGEAGWAFQSTCYQLLSEVHGCGF